MMRNKMVLKHKLILIFLIPFLILTQASALTANGSGNTFSYIVTSNANNNPSSENFKNYLVVGSINADMSSSNFKTGMGFSRTAPYLDDESCEVDSECVGGYCCSSLCQSTACPSDDDEEAAVGGGAAGGGGGIGAGAVTEPEVQFDVKILEFDAFEGEFIGQLFDITFSLEDSIINSSDELEAIVTFESFAIRPVRIKLGDFFNFTYFLKGVGDVNNDVTLDFQIEKDGEIVSSGSDMIYMGSFEEKTETARLFLPNNLTSGKYRFIVQVNYGNYTAESQRTIYLTVSGGEGFIIPATDLTFIILDENGNEVYREKDSIVVETEKVLRKSFKGLNLPEGKYTLILQTLYNVDVFDEFKQDFEIRREDKLQLLFYYIKKFWIAGLVAVFLIFMIVFMIIKRSEKEEQKRVFSFLRRIGLVKTEKEKKEIAKKKEEQKRITEEMEKRRLQTLKRVEAEKEKQKEFDISREEKEGKRKQREKIKKDIFTLFHDLGLVKTKEEKAQIRKQKEEERERKEKEKKKSEEKRTKQREKEQKLNELERKKKELKKQEDKVQEEIDKIKGKR